MDFSGLFPCLEGTAAFQALLERLKAEAKVGLNVPEAARPFLLATLHRTLSRPILVITGRAETARGLHEELQAWGVEALLFPEPDPLPYERLASDPVTVHRRLKALHALLRRPDPLLIVASAIAVARPSPAPDAFSEACQTLVPGARLELREALARWLALGYEVAPASEVPGAIARRGGILDIYPATADLPARLELVGDRIESLRQFHPETQRSLALLASLEITPAREIVPNHDPLENLNLEACPREVRERLEEDVAKILAGQPVEASDFYAPLFNKGCLADYLPPQGLLILEEPGAIRAALEELDDQARGIRQGQVERGELPPNFPRPYLLWPELEAQLKGQRLTLSPWGAQEGLSLPFSANPNFNGRWQAFLERARAWLREGRSLVVVSHQARRLAELLAEVEIWASPQGGLSESPPPGSLSLIQGALAGGFSLETAQGPLALLTDAEVFGVAKKKRRGRHRFHRREEPLAPGDYVVHIDHGIARFGGLVRLTQDSHERDYLLLEYAAEDRLYVPTDQAGRVNRYIGRGGYAPTLTRLGTHEWARAKEKVTEAAAKLARELLELYSDREVVRGITYSSDTIWQQGMEASFPYVETPDQAQAIAEVKADMERPRPMDRLVCGDVGYGKTEVALRAAFKAIQDGGQVAVLTPTTVLAQQHWHTFKERLEPFPVTVEVLSRFRSPAQQQEVLQRLAQGKVDICIGTHRLLQKDITFKNLGLVIIDEEQRFGVAHKERLKQLRREVDVLTLSATPIPRTLHMTLTGLRDMSTIETPPEERLPIKTFVGPYEPRAVREAILREMERGGQVFFVHNRVQSITSVARELEALVPEAEIVVAHGQMPEAQLESVMLDFASGHHNVLACTTIIESGLDLPNVNTLIVNGADRLGLSQLYQLRGRVGRGSERAYAYFFHEPGKRLTEPARKRLQTIFEATELGAGFHIAMKDLEIRGAGNILGPEQSGHIGAVGFDLYCRLLAEAVEGLKSTSSPQPPPPTIDLPLDANLPEDYAPDPGTRLELYQRLALVSDEEALEDLKQEMADRLGPPPEVVRNLLYGVRLKVLGARGGVASISEEEGQMVVRLRDEVKLDRERWAGWPGLRVLSNQVRLNMDGDWQKKLLEVVGEMGLPEPKTKG